MRGMETNLWKKIRDTLRERERYEWIFEKSRSAKEVNISRDTIGTPPAVSPGRF